jgi:hypothetical protein
MCFYQTERECDIQVTQLVPKISFLVKIQEKLPLFVGLIREGLVPKEALIRNSINFVIALIRNSINS